MGLTRVAVLVSGSGTNLQALIDAARDHGAGYAIVAVLADRPDAFGLERARAAGIPAGCIERRAFADRAGFEDALDATLVAAEVDLVCLAGFMRVLGPAFVASWRDRLVNIHPSLLPAFPGLATHARVLASSALVHGCTVHAVRAAVDAGPILAQGVVPVLPDDDAASLAARVLTLEHRIYPAVVRLLASGRLRVEGERVVAADPIAQAQRLVLHPAFERRGRS